MKVGSRVSQGSGRVARNALAGSGVDAALALEHRRLMRGNHRVVDWTQSTAASLPPALRASIGELWLAIMEAEHRSAGIFATYVLDLMGAGAPSEVLSVASRGVLDEVRHATLCAQLASLYTGRPSDLPAGIPHVPDLIALTQFEQAVRQALFLSIASETYSSVILAETREHARDPVVRAVLSVILADEVHHARLGWSYLVFLLRSDRREEVRAFVQSQLVAVFDDLALALFGESQTIPPPTYRGRLAKLAREHGYLSFRDQRRLFIQTLRTVWIPSFHSLGFDVTALRGRWRARS